MVDAVVDWIEAELLKLESDARLSYAPADVRINAPLALEQVAMESRHETLTQVLERLRAEKDRL